jgi:hypothetical protein
MGESYQPNRIVSVQRNGIFRPASIAISDCMMRLGFAFDNGYEDLTVLCGAVITSRRGTGSGVSAQRVFTSRAPLDHQAVLTLAATRCVNRVLPRTLTFRQPNAAVRREFPSLPSTPRVVTHRG